MRKAIARMLLPVSVIGAVALGSATGIAAAGEPTPPAGCQQKQLAPASGSDPCVKWLQQDFNKYQGEHLAEDGIYGPETMAAVKRYQQSRSVKADGIVGPQTWARIMGRP